MTEKKPLAPDDTRTVTLEVEDLNPDRISLTERVATITFDDGEEVDIVGDVGGASLLIYGSRSRGRKGIIVDLQPVMRKMGEIYDNERKKEKKG